MFKKLISLVFAIIIVTYIDPCNMVGNNYSDGYGEIYHHDIDLCPYHNSRVLIDEEFIYIGVTTPEEILKIKRENKEVRYFHYEIGLPADIDESYITEKLKIKEYIETHGYVFCCEEPASISFRDSKDLNDMNLSIKCYMTITQDAEAKSVEEFFKKFEVARSFKKKEHNCIWRLDLTDSEIFYIARSLEQMGYKLYKDKEGNYRDKKIIDF